MIDIRSHIVQEARSWIGVPFRHHGRSRAGVDCVGLLVVVYEATIGLSQGDFTEYPRHPETPFVYRTIRQYARRIAPANIKAGDVMLIRFGGASTHFGIVTDRGVVQASPSTGVIEHSLSKDHAGERVVACYRMEGLD